MEFFIWATLFLFSEKTPEDPLQNDEVAAFPKMTAHGGDMKLSDAGQLASP